MRRRRSRPLLPFVVCLLLFIPQAGAQDFRGTITGRVSDQAGASIQGASVSLKSDATGATTRVETDDTGSYTFLSLNPGTYTLRVEHSSGGFVAIDRPGVEVRVGERLTMDFTLEVGEPNVLVTITSETPLLEAASASAGQVIDRKRIAELPLSDGNPFVLTRLAPGLTYTGDLRFSRPFDNLGTSSVVAAGAPGGNEFTLDGSPNTGGLGQRVAFVPPADAVQEFKVVTVSFDAQQGHTAGANIDVSLRAGTNVFHGSLYEFVRNDVLSANDFFLNRAGQPRDALRYNRYGGTVGGPVIIPRLGEGGRGFLSGRNRYFFFFAYEGLKDAFPEPGQFTVPTLAERRGDFSALLPSGIQIYDPHTGVQAGSRVVRSPFAGNVIPQERLSPVALSYLSFYPLPNQPGDAQGRNNFISANTRTDTFNSESLRLDFTFTERHSAFFRYTRNNREESRGNWTGLINGIRPTGTLLFRNNNGATYDHVYTASPTLVLNLRAGFTRFHSPTRRPSEGAFDPASLGFSPRASQLFAGASYLPRFDIGEFSPLGDALGSDFTHSIYSLQGIATKVSGGHTIRAGYDFRVYREDSSGPGHAAGRYEFRTDFTRGPFDNSSPASIGQDLAAFLLGQPTGGIIERNTARSNQSLYQGIFFQDDWKATKNLTLNLGLRYEYEGPTTERFNRNVRGFDESAPNPVEQAARAAYALNPIPEIAPQEFRVRGGLLFATAQDRGFWESDKNNLQPRLGFAYRLSERTVLRGGWAIYTIPFVIDGVQQAGFSQSANLVPTQDNGLTFRASLFDPFPEGLAPAQGSESGLATFIGRDIEFVPVDRSNGQSQRWQLSLEREVRGGWLFELAYVGSYSYDLSTETDILNAIPRRYLSTASARDQALIDFLTASVPNPFQGLAPGTSLNSATVQRQQLLRPFPQFGNIRTRRDDGSSTYNAGQLRVEKRFSRGYTLLVSYTFSKLLERVSFLNPTDTEYEKRISAADAPHRLVMSGIWELPFGRGRRWGTGLGDISEALLGGWQVQAIWQAQSGRPLELGNLYFAGDPSTLRSALGGETVDAAFDTSGFYFSDAAVRTNGAIDPSKQRNDPRIRLLFNLRRLPTRLPSLRGQALNLWDLSVIKNFLLNDRARLQLRGEFLNAFNHPQFNNPGLDPLSSSFGRITSQANLPRNVQLGLKLIF